MTGRTVAGLAPAVVVGAGLAGTLVVAAAQGQPEVPPWGVPSGPAVVASFESAMVTAPPAALGLDPFYTKFTDAIGIPVVAGPQVEDTALLVARDIVNHMLAKRFDLRQALVAREARVMIMAYEEGQMNLPEYRDWTKPAFEDRRLTRGERERYYEPGGIASLTDADYWNRRARGMGGIRTSCAEENLLGMPGTKYFGEHICVHEFSHGVMSAIRAADPPLYDAIQAAYASARERGLFEDHYGGNTVAEYWAEGTQWWFWSNYRWTDDTRDPPVTIWSPDDLRAYDPTLFGLLEQVYPDHRIPADIYHGVERRQRR